MAQSFRYMVIPIFATTVYAYCLFGILSYMGNDFVSSYNFFAALICSLASGFVNYRFAFREHSIAALTILNGVLLALTLFFCFAAPNDIEGFWTYVLAVVAFVTPVVFGLHLSRNPIKLSTMLLLCEFSIIGTIILFVMRDGVVSISSFSIGISIVALILNLFMLSVLRITGPAKKNEGWKKGVQRGTLLSVSLAGIIFVAALVTLLVLPASRNAIFTAVYFMRDLFVLIGRAIERFFEFLAALIPEQPQYSMDMPGEEGLALPAEETLDMPQGDIGIWVFIGCVAIAAAVFLYFLVRYRRKRVSAKITAVMVYEEETGEGWRILRFLLGLPARFKAWLHFQKCRMKRRGTYEEAFLRIAYSAKRRGIHREQSETPGAYLERIAALLPSGPPAPNETHNAGGFRELLGAVAAAVDRRLYSGKAQDYERLTVHELECLAHILGAIGDRRRIAPQPAPEKR